MKPASAKQKGRLLQQWVRDTILKVFPSLTGDDVRSTSSGSNGEDILLSPKARKLVPFSIECKSKAKFVGYTFMEQAKQNAPSGVEPIVIVKGNRMKPLAILDADYFFNMLKGK